jgi:hypothetical protein
VPTANTAVPVSGTAVIVRLVSWLPLIAPEGGKCVLAGLKSLPNNPLQKFLRVDKTQVVEQESGPGSQESAKQPASASL